MEPIQIFYKELKTDENNMFTAKISEKKEIENVKFSKTHEYGVTGLTIKPDAGSFFLIKVTNKGKLKVISKKNTKFSQKKLRNQGQI